MVARVKHNYWFLCSYSYQKGDVTLSTPFWHLPACVQYRIDQGQSLHRGECIQGEFHCDTVNNFNFVTKRWQQSGLNCGSINIVFALQKLQQPVVDPGWCLGFHELLTCQAARDWLSKLANRKVTVIYLYHPDVVLLFRGNGSCDTMELWFPVLKCK